MADEPLDVSTLIEVIDQLIAPHRSLLARLIETDGQSCEMPRNLLSALQNRGLVTTVLDELTQGVRLCQAGCGHVWYEIPDAVADAYAQWLEASQGAPATSPPLPAAGEEHPATEALATAARRLVSPPPPEQFWARIMNPLYGWLELYGVRYDQGQLLTLRGDWGDERLVRLGYVEKAPSDRAYLQAQCGACEAWFLNEHFRDKHGAARHRDRFRSPEEIEMGGGLAGPDGGAALRDITGDSFERRQWTEFPPHLEKSKASQQA